MTTVSPPDLRTLAVELQSLGVRTTHPDEGPGATRAGGADPPTPASSGWTARR